MLSRSTVGALLVASACVACGRPERPAASAPIDASAAWDRMKRVLPGTWHAQTPHGAGLDVSFKVVSSGSALLETYGVGGAHETVTVFYRDHGDLWLTHYCAQGNEPRLRATVATPSDVVLRFVDATNVSPDQGVMMERRLHFDAGAADAFDLTESYRSPDGSPDVTTLHFVRAAATAPEQR